MWFSRDFGLWASGSSQSWRPVEAATMNQRPLCTLLRDEKAQSVNGVIHSRVADSEFDISGFDGEFVVGTGHGPLLGLGPASTLRSEQATDGPTAGGGMSSSGSSSGSVGKPRTHSKRTARRGRQCISVPAWLRLALLRPHRRPRRASRTVTRRHLATPRFLLGWRRQRSQAPRQRQPTPNRRAS